MEDFEKIIGEAALGIEFGSTRIKAVLADGSNKPIASGSHTWENKFVDGLWTYSEDEIISGLRSCYADLKADVKKKYGVTLKKVGCMGFSAMMHGYMVFGPDGKLLVPFRTWRNNNAECAAKKLTGLFSYNIPARWSIAHLYQAILNGEEHVKDIAFQTTLAGYIHWLLTGVKALGIGEASGMFPIDADTKDYDGRMISLFDNLVSDKNYPWKLKEILPKVLLAGDDAGCLTEEGRKILDPDGDLESGVPLCPPEGDAGTGMVATNSVKVRTGNVSAGTSIFGMVVLEKNLSKAHDSIDLVTTPAGDLVAMVHCNNCTSDINAWVNVFKEFAELIGCHTDDLYGVLYNEALKGDADCGGVISYNYLSGENITA